MCFLAYRRAVTVWIGSVHYIYCAAQSVSSFGSGVHLKQTPTQVHRVKGHGWRALLGRAVQEIGQIFHFKCESSYTHIETHSITHTYTRMDALGNRVKGKKKAWIHCLGFLYKWQLLLSVIGPFSDAMQHHWACGQALVSFSLCRRGPFT